MQFIGDVVVFQPLPTSCPRVVSTIFHENAVTLDALGTENTISPLIGVVETFETKPSGAASILNPDPEMPPKPASAVRVVLPVLLRALAV
jgi:hypothetical protein